MIRFVPPFRGRYIDSISGGATGSIASIGVAIGVTCAGIVTHDASATVAVEITTTASGQQTDQQYDRSANISVTIEATASGGLASQTHSSSTADCQVNISASADGYNVDTTIPDETNNSNNMLMTGSAWTFATDAAIGTRSVNFTGVSGEYGTIDDSFQTTLRSPWSFSCWYKPSEGDVGQNHYPYLFSQATMSNSGSSSYYYLRHVGQKFLWATKIGEISTYGSNFIYTSNNIFASGTGNDWVHIVVTLDNYGDPTIYIDGSAVALTTDSTPNTLDISNYSNTTDVKIGGTGALNIDYKIDDVALWSTELTSTQVSNLYNSGSGTDLTGSSNLAGWWKMGDSNVVATTHSGTASCQVNLSASASGSAFTPFTNSYSIDLDGTNDHIDVSNFDPSTEIGTGAFTMSMWMKADSDANQIFWYMGDSSINTMMRLNYLASSGGFKIWANISGSWTNQYPHVDITTSTGTWYHVAVVRSGTTVTLYVNGTNSDSKTHASLATGFGSVHNVGKYVTSHHLDGHIDEYALWDEALTSTEIEAIYNSGTPINLASDSGNYASSANLVGYWRMEEGSGTSIADSSTNSNTATLYNGPTFSTDVPVYSNNYSIALDGSNDYLKTSFSPSGIGTGNYSIGLWFNMTSGATEDHPYFFAFGANSSSTTNTYQGLGLTGRSGDGYKVRVNNYYGSSYTQSASSSTSDVTAGTWYHLLLVRSGNTLTVYKDGSSFLTLSNSDVSSNDLSLGSEFRLGYGYGAASRYVKGLIDEVGLWDVALSSADATAIYNSGTPNSLTASSSYDTDRSGDLQGYWRFEENTGTSITDTSGNGNTITLTNGPTFSTTTPS